MALNWNQVLMKSTEPSPPHTMLETQGPRVTVKLSGPASVPLREGSWVSQTCLFLISLKDQNNLTAQTAGLPDRTLLCFALPSACSVHRSTFPAPDTATGLLSSSWVKQCLLSKPNSPPTPQSSPGTKEALDKCLLRPFPSR